VEIPVGKRPLVFQQLGGLAVGHHAGEKLRIEWDYGENAGYDAAS
jgi:hypothetical protein